MLKALNLWKEEDASKITAELDKLDTPAPPIDTSKITDSTVKQLVDQLQQAVTLLTNQNKQLIESLSKEKEMRDNAYKIQQDQMKADKEKKVKDAVQKLLDEGKISSDDEKALWTKAFENDLDIATKQAAVIPVKPGFKPAKKPGEPTPPAKKEEEVHLRSPLETPNTAILKAVKEFAQVTE